MESLSSKSSTDDCSDLPQRRICTCQARISAQQVNEYIIRCRRTGTDVGSIRYLLLFSYVPVLSFQSALGREAAEHFESLSSHVPLRRLGSELCHIPPKKFPCCRSALRRPASTLLPFRCRLLSSLGLLFLLSSLLGGEDGRMGFGGRMRLSLRVAKGWGLG